jgi:hypothetical protein
VNTIGLLIEDVDGRIRQLSELRESLVKCVPLLTPGNRTEGTPGAKTGPAAKAKAKRKAVARTVTLEPKAPAAPAARPASGEKPDTVVGAIKVLLRDETAPFTSEELIENLREDADYKPLLEREGGMKALQNALYNWSNAGKLKKDGENYTVTAVGKEWMNA